MEKSIYSQFTELDKTFFDELRDKYVPDYGIANTVAGEMIRAMDRLIYRWYNDGDRAGIGYGRETCNSSYRYLANMLDKYDEYCPMLTTSIDDEEYEARIYNIALMVQKVFQKNQEVFTKLNEFDSREKDPEEDYDDTYYDGDEYDCYDEDDDYDGIFKVK